MSNNRPDLRRSIDCALAGAAAAQRHVQGNAPAKVLHLMRQSREHRRGVALAMVLGGGSDLLGPSAVPDADAIWALNRESSVMFVDRDGEILGVRGPYYGRRTPPRWNCRIMCRSLLAIEDRRFYEHEGVDRMAVLRACSPTCAPAKPCKAARR